MGIKVELNPDLAPRSIEEFKKGKRKKEECIPAKLVNGKRYAFLKRGQRHYALGHKTPLVETNGAEKLSAPIAAIRILETTHFIVKGEVFTRGTYVVDKLLKRGWEEFGGYGT